MAITVAMPDTVDTSASNFLSEPGVYHVAVLEAMEAPTKRDGGLIQNAAFGVDLEVLAGPQAKKQKDVVFFNADTDKPKDDKGYQMDLRKIRRFFEAVGVAPERTPGGTEYTVDVEKARGRQLIIQFEKDTRAGKEKNLQVYYANIWHVDDPDPAAKCERNQDALKLLPAALRRKPESFKPATTNGNGNGQSNGNGSANKQQSQQPIGAGDSTGVDLDDV